MEVSCERHDSESWGSCKEWMTSSPASKRTECVVPREISLHKCGCEKKQSRFNNYSAKSAWHKHDLWQNTVNTLQTQLQLFLSSSNALTYLVKPGRQPMFKHIYPAFLQHTLATALRCVISASKIITFKPVFFVSPCARADCLVFWHWTHEAIMIPFRIWVGKNPIPSRNVDSWFSYWLL